MAHNIDLLPIIGGGYLASIWINEKLMLYSVTALIYCVYHVAFEAAHWEATPGKRIMGLIVRSSSSKKIGFYRVFWRTLFKFLSLALVFTGFTMIQFHRKKQGLHDIIAGTMVLYQEKR
ncbi:MAG: RDD family protein [Cyclobacteriaceae bacterium]|nr:RDD family protein [Cyclobacteriaceae bacterium HetDA_MAG_MS6]